MIGPVARVILALLIAGVAHLSSVLALPWLAARDGYVRLSALAADNQMGVIAGREIEAALPFADPAVAVAACRYVLDKGPVRLRVAVGAFPMSLVLIRKGAGIFHSVSDKAATQGVLEVVVATPDQMDQITELDTDDEPVQEIRVISAEETGLALVRALSPTPSQRGEAERVFAGATCEQETLEQQ